jgi:glycosyltransferase involved in cell wall biosynthesis
MVTRQASADTPPMSPTILHVPRRFVAHEWGGTETVITEIARQQLTAGQAPKIVTSMALADRPREILHGIPIERHRHLYPFLGLSTADIAALDKKGGNLLSLPLFTALLREPNVRLFHAHSLKRLGGSVATAARLRRKPFVVSLHGGVFDVPAAELDTLTRPIRGRFEWGRAFGALFRSRQLLSEADLVLCVGQGEYDAARARLPHDRIAYLPNGVDSTRFTQGDGARFRQRYGLPQDAFFVLNISRIDAQKNQLQLIDAFARIQPRPSGAPAHLVLIGPETQPDYAATLRRRITELGLRDRIHLLPGLRHDDPTLLDAYQACDVFVLPSMHEPFGIVVLEAWSAGKPVITSRVGGLRSLIDHGRTGFFFENRDHLAALLTGLRDDPGLRRALGTAGRREATARYDWQGIHRLQEALYQQAEAHHQSRSHPARASRPTPAFALPAHS